MNLADELMGIRPKVNLSPGRLVSHDDPPILHISERVRGTGTIGRVADLLKTGEYTAQEIADELQVEVIGLIRRYLGVLETRGQAKRVGRKPLYPGAKKASVTVWGA